MYPSRAGYAYVRYQAAGQTVDVDKSVTVYAKPHLMRRVVWTSVFDNLCQKEAVSTDIRVHVYQMCKVVTLDICVPYFAHAQSTWELFGWG